MMTINIKKIHIQNRSLQPLLTEYILILPLFLSILTDFLGLPSLLKYTIDIAWVGLLVLTLIKKRVSIHKRILPLLCIVLCFFLFALIVYGFRFQSLAYFLWGTRNNFRFYVAFFAFAAFLSEDDVKKWFRVFDVLFWINVVVSLIQFFILGYSQDYLGGIFGVGVGCNGNTLLFFSVVLTISTLQMMTGEKKTVSCIAQLLAASVIAAMAELKAFFLVLAAILLMATILTNFSWKKCVLIFMAAICLFVGSSILVRAFGHSSSLSLENIVNLFFAESYASKDDLSRTNAIPVISRTILKDPISRWVGLGLGNCDTSAFALCNTPFFQAHEHLHYTWFSSAFLFLETGYIGLILYLSFFVVCLIIAFMQMKKKTVNPLFAQIAIITSAVCCVLTIYNCSLRMDIGYLAYFALALPFLNRRDPGTCQS